MEAPPPRAQRGQRAGASPPPGARPPRRAPGAALLSGYSHISYAAYHVLYTHACTHTATQSITRHEHDRHNRSARTNVTGGAGSLRTHDLR